MSIAPTRRVSGSTTARRIEKNYAVGSAGEQFVELIDTNNNVLVRDESNDHGSPKKKFTPVEEKRGQEVSTAPTYVSSAIEALAASGVYDEPEDTPDSSQKVGVYDNNQAIIKDEEIDRTGQNYLKHFYEKNEIIAEVDELI